MYPFSRLSEFRIPDFQIFQGPPVPEFLILDAGILELVPLKKSGTLEFWNLGSEKIWNSGLLELRVSGERFS